MSQPFARAAAMLALIAAAMRSANPQFALAQIPAYESRGKGGKRPWRSNTGVAASRRAAAKARNIATHRRASK